MLIFSVLFSCLLTTSTTQATEPSRGTPQTEFVCSSRCVMVIGKDKGPETGIRIPSMFQELPIFKVFMNWKETQGIGTVTELRFPKNTSPIWIEIDPEKTYERVWQGLKKGPQFLKIDTAYADEGLVEISATYNGEKWQNIVWNPKDGTMIDRDDLVIVRDNYPMPETNVLHR